MIKIDALRPRDAALEAAYRGSGAWRDVTLGAQLDNAVGAELDRVVITDDQGRLTLRELREDARRLARWLQGQGVGRGDVVSFQLPNWREVFIIDAAACLLGAVSNPIVPIYRDAEVEFILRDARSKVFFAPDSFRSSDFASMLTRIRTRLPDLVAAVTVRGEGEFRFDEVLRTHDPLQQAIEVSGVDPRLLLYTSGTTGRAKGVVHNYNSLDCEVRTASAYWGVGGGDVLLMPSPLTHITGYLYGIMFAQIVGTTTVLMEKWDAAEALALIERHQVNATVAATTFLQELTIAARAAGNSLPSLRVFPCGGAPVAPEIVRRATDAFENCAVFRVYGCTELPTVTLGSMERGSEVAASTDGVVHGSDVKIVDEGGRPVLAGCEGEILMRGPELMAGYLRPEDNYDAFDAEGYFRSGDLGVLRADNAIVVTGRKKDLIIRGGENISAKEIEDALHEHADITEAAVVAMPHERFGEAVCAFITPASLAGRERDLARFVSERGLAKQKIPERFVFVDALPKTPAGKVKKFELRNQLK